MDLPFALFESVQGSIYANCGVYIPESRMAQLQERIQQRMFELRLPNLPSYLHYLENYPRQEMHSLAWHTLTSGGFSGASQIQYLCDILLKDIVKFHRKTSSHRLQIWNAGCRTGEEAFAIALAVRHQLGIDVPLWDVRIRATDPSARALVRARAAVYTDPVLQQWFQAPKALFAEPAGDGRWQLDPQLRDLVRFEQRESTTVPPGFGDGDLILCRHGLTSCSRSQKQAAIQQFHASLRIGGWLVLGSQESLQGLHPGFRLVLYNGGIAYQKSCPEQVGESPAITMNSLVPAG